MWGVTSFILEIDIDNIKQRIGADILDLARQARLNQTAFALWRNPDTQDPELLISLNAPQKGYDWEIESLNSGFLFAPFETSNKGFFLPADLYFSANSELKIDPLLSKQSIASLEKLLANKLPKKGNERNELLAAKDLEAVRNTFIDQVNSAKTQMEEGDFDKVVLARKQRYTFSSEFDPFLAFTGLCERYPKAFVNLVYIPGQELWLGATPEKLIGIKENRYFETVALAGTKADDGSTSVMEVLWSQKEIEEQAYVSRYIINCLKKIRLRDFGEIGPKTVSTGNLFHLSTKYKVDMERTGFPMLGSTMLKLLHPTSATGGMPKEPALNFIKANENLDRSFYSGYLGTVNFDGDTNLYVNLRCGKCSKNQIELFAGVGITRDSIAKKEWKETQLKMDTIANTF